MDKKPEKKRYVVSVNQRPAFGRIGAWLGFVHQSVGFEKIDSTQTKRKNISLGNPEHESFDHYPVQVRQEVTREQYKELKMQTRKQKDSYSTSRFKYTKQYLGIGGEAGNCNDHVRHSYSVAKVPFPESHPDIKNQSLLNNPGLMQRYQDNMMESLNRTSVGGEVGSTRPIYSFYKAIVDEKKN